jgi:NAD+ kinase
VTLLSAVDGHHRVALVVHPHRGAATTLAKLTREWWESRGHTVIEDPRFGSDDARSVTADVDLAISLGGDGTMLRTVHLAAPRGVPILGVNLGNLGYLTTVEPDEIESAFTRLVEGRFQIDERMTLEVTVTSARGAHRPEVLLGFNEVVVEKTSAGHTIRLQAMIGGQHFLRYVADGILVATPTGSTAYNLSLRGPILSPRLRALVLTPISPHMLFDRTLIVEPEESIHLEVLSDRPAVVVVDGLHPLGVEPGDRITVTAGPHPAKVVQFGPADFYKVLRSKFGLADR